MMCASYFSNRKVTSVRVSPSLQDAVITYIMISKDICSFRYFKDASIVDVLCRIKNIICLDDIFNQIKDLFGPVIFADVRVWIFCKSIISDLITDDGRVIDTLRYQILLSLRLRELKWISVMTTLSSPWIYLRTVRRLYWCRETVAAVPRHRSRSTYVSVILVWCTYHDIRFEYRSLVSCLLVSFSTLQTQSSFIRKRTRYSWVLQDYGRDLSESRQRYELLSLTRCRWSLAVINLFNVTCDPWVLESFTSKTPQDLRFYLSYLTVWRQKMCQCLHCRKYTIRSSDTEERALEFQRYNKQQYFVFYVFIRQST